MTRVGQEEVVAITASNIKADFKWRMYRHRRTTPLLRDFLGLTPEKELSDFLMWHFNHLNHVRQEYLETQSQG